MYVRLEMGCAFKVKGIFEGNKRTCSYIFMETLDFKIDYLVERILFIPVAILANNNKKCFVVATIFFFHFSGNFY